MDPCLDPLVATDQAVLPSTDEIYSWAKTQGNVGIAVLFIRAYDSRQLTDQLISQAIKVRQRQIDEGRFTPSFESAPTPAAPVRSNPVTGIYTIEHAKGHTTFRIRIQETTSNFAPGQTVIAMLTGPDNESDYTSFGFLRDGRLHPFKSFRSNEGLLELANDFLRNPDADNVKASKRCARCHRLLTTPESVAAGFGPECASKGIR